jgi:glucose-1-phosphate thymidylyltransferase
VKVLLSLLPLETLYKPDRWSRPLGLWRLAGKPIAGHLLERLRELWDAPAVELCLVVGQENSSIAAWSRDRFAGHSLRLLALPVNTTLLEIAWQIHEWWGCDEAVWLLEGNAILEADFHAGDSLLRLVGPTGEPMATPAAVFSRNGMELWTLFSNASLGHLPTPSMNEWLEDLLVTHRAGVSITDAYTYLPVARWAGDCWQSDEELLLQANTRLLGLGSGSDDAVERSYTEDFTVLPPVYLHESAVIDGSVIGPYTSVEAGATIRNSVVSNSIVGSGAQISNMILDNSIIGEGATAVGLAQALLLADNQ